MYKFKSLKKGSSDTKYTPSNNMRFNGKYLNEEINGYQQLNVGGRSLISRSIETVNVPMRSGSWFNYIQDDMRELTIEYRLIGRTTSELRNQYEKLNKLLRSDEPVAIQFDDEKEWTYYGIFTDSPNEIENKTSLVSTFKIICPDPFKYKAIKTGNVGSLESEYVYPIKMVITLNRNTKELKITNGKEYFELIGNYATGDKIAIEWGDELSVKKNGTNILHELKQFTEIDFFKLYPNGTVSSPQATITELKWRDRTL